MDSSDEPRLTRRVEGVDGQRQSPPRCSTPQQMHPPSALQAHSDDASEQQVASDASSASCASSAQHESSTTGSEQQQSESLADSGANSGADSGATRQQQLVDSATSAESISPQDVAHGPPPPTPKPRGHSPPTASERPKTSDMTSRNRMVLVEYSPESVGVLGGRGKSCISRSIDPNKTLPSCGKTSMLVLWVSLPTRSPCFDCASRRASGRC